MQKPSKLHTILQDWSTLTTDAERSFAIGRLTRAYKLSNQSIRTHLHLTSKKVSYYRSAAKLSDAELEYFHENFTRISLSHVRLISRFTPETRIELLKKIAGPFPLSTHGLERIVRGQSSSASFTHLLTSHSSTGSPFENYEDEIANKLGRSTVQITYDPDNQTGTLTLSFYQLSQLDSDLSSLGFVKDEF